MTNAARELVTTERLREFFAPRSIALVGASDNSGWARLIVASCKTSGFGGPRTAVHPKAGRAFACRCAQPARPARTGRPGLHPGAGTGSRKHPRRYGPTGIPNGVVLASGYREVGSQGKTLEDALVARAVANGVTILGPNCLGLSTPTPVRRLTP